ncbi:hypothetical protein ACQ4PT_069691 [Festuca glaucescens]
MLKLKRIASFSNGRQKFRKRRRVKEVSGILSDGRREAAARHVGQEQCWNDLSQEHATKLSPSIVSLASFDGDKVHYKSTGIVVRNSSSRGTSVLTSSALVSTLDAERWLMPQLKIKLRLPNKRVVVGWIQHYDLPFSMVVIGTRFSPALRVACLSDSLQVEPHTELLAVKRCYDSGILMETRGELIDGQSEVESEGFMLSTCKITMDASGGPLVDSDGNIVGMNDYYGQKITLYVQTDKILECVRDLWFRYELQNFSIDFKSFSEGELRKLSLLRLLNYTLRDYSFPFSEFTKDKPTPEFSMVEPTPPLTEDELIILDPCPSDDFTKEVNAILRSDGYPLPAYADGGMYLNGVFEEEFGTNMWSKPTRKVALMKSKSIVALAPFNDKERHFACTGVSIDCDESTSTVLTSASLVRTTGDENKIVDKLRVRTRHYLLLTCSPRCWLTLPLQIEVFLPTKRRIIGTLLHYDLSYNVAVVSVPIFCESHASISVEATQTKVVALGRAFKSGNLMATDGLMIGEQDKFDCRELKCCSCKITKAGIGGPLYDLSGNFVGMNFYDTEGTPYLPSNIILKLLRSFDAERTVAAEIMEKPNYSWPVPKPYWYYPSHHRKKGELKWILE